MDRFWRRTFMILLGASLLTGCGDEVLILGTMGPDATPDAGSMADVDGQDAAPEADAPIDEGDVVDDAPVAPMPSLAETRAVQTERFATAPVCAQCHSNSPDAQAMRDDFEEGVAPYDLWKASMMAMSSRDPFWRAMVSAEALRTPALADVIEAECMRCHTPMATRSKAAEEGVPMTLALLEEDSDLGQLALDGISCTLCHQMSPEGLDTPESYSGHFLLNTDKAIYGPFENIFSTPMRNETGFTPTYGPHLSDSGACGTCHMLFTPTVKETGEVTGHMFAEQTTFLEWRNSSYRTGEGAGPKARPCQHCHMPNTDALGGPITTRIARAPQGDDFAEVNPRAPFRRHTLVGGNVQMLTIMRDARAVLAPGVSLAAFDASIEQTMAQLTQKSGRVQVASAMHQGEGLAVQIAVEHEVGHKFPTGFPSRRAWLRVRVFDAQNQVIFSSGDFDTRGRIIDGNTGQPLASESPGGPFQPHFTTITRQDQAQIYESVMGDEAGEPTATLLRAAIYLKDNRLLPEGYSFEGPDADLTRPVGVGPEDEDFINGQDTVHYLVPLAPDASPVAVEVMLVYQSLGARFMAELFEVSTREVDHFRSLYERADARPVIVAQHRISVLP